MHSYLFLFVNDGFRHARVTQGHCMLIAWTLHQCPLGCQFTSSHNRPKVNLLPPRNASKACNSSAMCKCDAFKYFNFSQLGIKKTYFEIWRNFFYVGSKEHRGNMYHTIWLMCQKYNTRKPNARKIPHIIFRILSLSVRAKFPCLKDVILTTLARGIIKISLKCS